MPDRNRKTFGSNQGFSIIELLVILVIVGILTALAIPAMVSQRRLLRSSSAMREIMSQMRHARQLSMSQRHAVTFQYDNATKLITIINHNNNHKADNVTFPGCNLGRKEILVAVDFPLTSCSRVVTTYSMIQGGLTASEVAYGIPAPIPASKKLGDLTGMQLLVSQKIDITFQNDGSVIGADGIPVDQAMFFYNVLAPHATASAISVIGTSGRVKIWRYSTSVDDYIE